MADVFNLFTQQRALDCDADTQTSFPALNPGFGQPSRTNLAQLQTPRQSIPSSNRLRRVFLV